jgi:hypothetical protein
LDQSGGSIDPPVSTPSFSSLLVAQVTLLLASSASDDVVTRARPDSPGIGDGDLDQSGGGIDPPVSTPSFRVDDHDPPLLLQNAESPVLQLTTHPRFPPATSMGSQTDVAPSQLVLGQSLPIVVEIIVVVRLEGWEPHLRPPTWLFDDG